MRAAAIDKFGDPEVLKLQTLRVPIPDPREVLIEVDTAGVGPWDADIRGGWSPGGHIKFPYVLGYEGSGRVVSLGSHIHRFNISDHVYAYSWNNPQGGFYAEYTAVPAEKVAPIPKKLDLFHAGAVPISGLTALQGIDDVLAVAFFAPNLFADVHVCYNRKHVRGCVLRPRTDSHRVNQHLGRNRRIDRNQ